MSSLNSSPLSHQGPLPVPLPSLTDGSSEAANLSEFEGGVHRYMGRHSYLNASLSAEPLGLTTLDQLGRPALFIVHKELVIRNSSVLRTMASLPTKRHIPGSPPIHLHDVSPLIGILELRSILNFMYNDHTTAPWHTTKSATGLAASHQEYIAAIERLCEGGRALDVPAASFACEQDMVLRATSLDLGGRRSATGLQDLKGFDRFVGALLRVAGEYGMNGFVGKVGKALMGPA